MQQYMHSMQTEAKLKNTTPKTLSYNETNKVIVIENPIIKKNIKITLISANL